MGYAGLWPHLVLNESEIMLCFSEDQSDCFHAYEIPSCWRGFFVLERKVPWQALGHASVCARALWDGYRPLT